MCTSISYFTNCCIYFSFSFFLSFSLMYFLNVMIFMLGVGGEVKGYNVKILVHGYTVLYNTNVRPTTPSHTYGLGHISCNNHHFKLNTTVNQPRYINNPIMGTPCTCSHIGTRCTTCSHIGIGSGQEAFQKIVKNNNPVCNLHIIVYVTRFG